MADDDDEDLYDEEFDFVDDDDEEDEADEADDDDDDEDDDYEEESAGDDTDLADESEPVEEPKPEPVRPRGRGDRDVTAKKAEDAGDTEAAEEPVDEYGRPEPAANYLVHVYEARKFKRTIDRPFTPEDAEAFASEYNRTNKNYSRFAITGKNDVKPKKILE